MRRLEPLVISALEHAAKSFHHPACEAGKAPQRKAYPVCECHVGKAKFALSLFIRHKDKQGRDVSILANDASGDELKAALRCRDDQTWVLCRRSPRAVSRYGADAMYLSEKQYRTAQHEALVQRARSMAVKPFGELGAPCA